MDTIGKYQLIRVIGEGGMGRVYEAIDPVIGRRVAIKTISSTVMANTDARARFLREAQAAGRLSHPNLITVHDIGETDETPYIVMEFLEGMDLSHKIRQERLSYDVKMQIMIDVCEGLAFAHGHDIIHRDIKPGNIFVTTDGRVKILDFGLARGALSEITQTGKILGTPNYMSPEQIRGDDVDHRADIFAAGVVFYELLSGHKAFEGESIATTIYKVLQTQPPPVHEVDERLPVSLSTIIERALAKDRVGRFHSSSEMLEAILHAHGRTTQLERSRLQTAPLPVPPAASSAPARRGGGTMAAVIVAAVLVTGVAGLVLWRQISKPRPSTAGVVVAPSRPADTTIVAPPVPARVAEPAPPVTAAAPAAVAAPAAANRPSTPPPKPPPTAETAKRREPSNARAAQAAPPLPPSPAAAQSPPPPDAAAPAPRPTAAASSSPSPRPETIEPPPAPAITAPVAAPPAAAPAPPSAATPQRGEERIGPAIQNVLTRYRAALESRDITALKRLWPTLAGRQEEALRSEFERSRGIAVSFDGVDIQPTPSGATLTCRRQYTVTTSDGQTLKTTTAMVMTLVRHDAAWSIDTIRHEVAR